VEEAAFLGDQSLEEVEDLVLDKTHLVVHPYQEVEELVLDVFTWGHSGKAWRWCYSKSKLRAAVKTEYVVVRPFLVVEVLR
jgi:S-adenosylmethionine/arginine decarboxylase-like enzyme